MSALAARPASCTKGGMDVDGAQVNAGLLRCPRCNSRMLTRKATLVADRPAADQVLHIPRPASDTDDGTPGSFTWETSTHTHWWRVADIDDFDSIGMSRTITNPAGAAVKIVLCSDCQAGPLGHRVEGCNEIYLAADLMVQQDPAAASAEEDFKTPEGTDMDQLRAMMAGGGLTTQTTVTFTAPRLGMCLADAPDGVGVAVVAFTDSGDGQPGAAEATGQIQQGDKVVRVNATSTKGLDYAATLDIIIAAPRPLAIMFERSPQPGGEAEVAARVPHTEWSGEQK